jgi:hypothetical protein
MTIKVSAEMMRLLRILADCPEGATQHELTMQGVRSSVLYEAVTLAIVRVMQERALGNVAYRFHVLPASIQLLDLQE